VRCSSTPLPLRHPRTRSGDQGRPSRRRASRGSSRREGRGSAHNRASSGVTDRLVMQARPREPVAEAFLVEVSGPERTSGRRDGSRISAPWDSPAPDRRSPSGSARRGGRPSGRDAGAPQPGFLPGARSSRAEQDSRLASRSLLQAMRPDARWRAAGPPCDIPARGERGPRLGRTDRSGRGYGCPWRGVLDVQQRDADDRVRFVERAIGGHAHMEFRHTRSVAKRRAPVITGAGVDSIDPHGKSSGAVEWIARFRRRSASERSTL
jgi:hypothetical protein